MVRCIKLDLSKVEKCKTIKVRGESHEYCRPNLKEEEVNFDNFSEAYSAASKYARSYFADIGIIEDLSECQCSNLQERLYQATERVKDGIWSMGANHLMVTWFLLINILRMSVRLLAVITYEKNGNIIIRILKFVITIQKD